MKCNVGKKERLGRLILGAGVIAAGAYFGSWWGALGLIFVVTGLIQWCPLSQLFGINTCES